MSFMDEFDSVMSQVMEELGKEENSIKQTDLSEEPKMNGPVPVEETKGKVLFEDVVSYEENEISSDDHQDLADVLMAEQNTINKTGSILDVDNLEIEDISIDNDPIAESLAHTDVLANTDVINNDISEDETILYTEKVMEEKPLTGNVEPFSKAVESIPEKTVDNRERKGTFSLDLEGLTGVDLKLSFGDEELFLSCDEDNVIITLNNGTSFKVPFNKDSKKVA